MAGVGVGIGVSAGEPLSDAEGESMEPLDDAAQLLPLALAEPLAVPLTSAAAAVISKASLVAKNSVSSAGLVNTTW